MAILNLIRNTTWERRCWQWNKAAVVNTMACQAQLVQGLHSPSPHYDDALGQIPTVPSNHRFTESQGSYRWTLLQMTSLSLSTASKPVVIPFTEKRNVHNINKLAG